mgnify:CR=1 FL=1
MKDFSLIKFKWTFRDYQQKVLDNANKHLLDKKIHIVAAPGSGKTVLGLELIRRLGTPALVLSPSVSIKQQWGDRFEECYLPETENVNEYVSFDIMKPSLLTSITYQALHAAVNRLPMETGADEDEFEAESGADFSDFDLISQVKTAGIKTLCLDEAHHLKSEWQRALEKFIGILGADVTVISLTATPPYDSEPNEWNRYISLCGEIDEEIFVPQLVKQKTLCPHQDYIYFSYPTEEEAETLRSYKQKARDCTKYIIENGYIAAALKNAGVIGEKPLSDEILYDNTDGFTALITLGKACGINIPSDIIKKLFGRKNVPENNIGITEKTFQFIIDKPEIFGEALSEELKNILLENSLIEKRKVQLITTDKINRMLASSMGKLKSIEIIAENDVNNLGDGLRMLVLTDFIKKEIKKSIGTDDELHTMGAVPVFEAIRRRLGEKTKVALLTGTLVILPDSAVASAQKISNEEKASCIVKPIEGTNHSEVVFGGSNKHKVGIITKIFALGEINILVGTKSLLGEGWDSPNINSLILASFVGSFMLSNQMRGRAIRIDKKNPDKVSNIWHLVTVLPDGDGKNTEEIEGDDFLTVKRRFSCFQAPSYNKSVIENGIKRIDILTPPFDNAGIDRINSEMLRISSDRKTAASRWDFEIKGSSTPVISDVSEVPMSVYPKKKVSSNKLYAIIFAVLAVLGIVVAVAAGFVGSVFGIAVTIMSLYFMIKKASFVTKNSTPEKTVTGLSRAVLKTLQQLKEIDSSPKIKVNVRKSADGKSVEVSLTGASERESKVFIKAISELFSPIEDPRYVIIGVTKIFKIEKRNFTNSFSCPSVIGVNKESAEVFRKYLKSPAGDFELVFTRSENGRKILNECKKMSFLNAVIS